MNGEGPSVSGRILLVDDDQAFRVSTATLLTDEGHRVAEAADGQAAVDALKGGDFDLILMDLRMPGVDGIQLVEVLRRWGENVPILMISGFGTVETAVEALHTGADDFLTKPVEPDVLIGKVADLLERRPSLPGGPFPREGEIIGRSAGMRAVLEAIQKVAPSDATVLIQGETGTGKELVARAIHRASTRASGPFVAVNCASLAEGLLESELFGHVKGAFTGAIQDKLGLFQVAHEGTLFLDEIGDVSPGLQHRLLRVLQEREFTPVGDVKPRQVNVRVVAATHRDLKDAIAQGTFREDLYYRLNVFRMEIPPLRTRTADIPLLIEHFLRPRGSSVAGPAVSPLVMRILQAYPWPGNVRHLFSVLESALIRAGAGSRIETQHLPQEIREFGDREASGLSLPGVRYVTVGSPEDEREIILAALEEAGGVRTKAAQLLGMGRTTLWRKLKEYGISPSNEA
jgi:DNA-binding NtrC family response regulator